MGKKKAVLGFYSCYATTVLTNGFESECSFAKCLTFLNPSPHKELRCSCCQEDAQAGNFNYQKLEKEDSAQDFISVLLPHSFYVVITFLYILPNEAT